MRTGPSNNVAEYSGFLAILEYLLLTRSQRDRTDKYSRRQQACNRTDARQSAYEKGVLHRHGKEGEGNSEAVFRKKPTLIWIPRDKNDIADELSKAELKKAGVEFRIQPEG